MSKTTYEAKAPTIDDFCDPETQKEKFPGFPCFLFTEEEFNSVKDSHLLKCTCQCCHKEFFRSKSELKKTDKKKYTKNVLQFILC